MSKTVAKAPGQGAAQWVFGGLYEVLASAAETAGAMTIMQFTPTRRLGVRCRSRLVSVCSLALGLLALAVPAAAAEPPLVVTIVERNVTLASESFPDDACGPRAVTETVTNKVQVTHLTAHADGSFHFVDFETGLLVADYVDPTIPDTTFRRTNTEVFNLTPGGTFTHTETLQQFDATLRITFRTHLTLVDGKPKVEREVMIVRGCP